MTGRGAGDPPDVRQHRRNDSLILATFVVPLKGDNIFHRELDPAPMSRGSEDAIGHGHRGRADVNPFELKVRPYLRTEQAERAMA